MNGTREQKLSFAINDNRSTIISNTSSITVMTMNSNTKSQYGKNESNKHLSMNRHGIKAVVERESGTKQIGGGGGGGTGNLDMEKGEHGRFK